MKLAKFKVKRIAIKEGKFMAFLVNHPYLSSSNDDEEASQLSINDQAPGSVLEGSKHNDGGESESLS